MATTLLPTEPNIEQRGQLALRCVIAVVVLAAVMLVQWPFGAPPPDFQAWVAADAVAASDGNPYDTDSLNAELRSDAETYGEIWQDDSGRFRMKFFHPPTWLALLTVLGFTPVAMSIAGVTALAVSVAYVSRDQEMVTFIGYVLAAAMVLLAPFSTSTIHFGQSGLLLAGLVGARIALARTPLEGTPLALLSFKPHIAFVTALPALIRHPRVTLQRLVPAALVVLAATAALYGVDIFGDFVRAVLGNDDSILANDDMTLRTLSPRWPLPASMNMATLVLAVGAVAVATRRWQGADAGTLVLFSLAVVVFLSGHGFEHDWLWVVLVPVVHRWNLVTTVAATAGFVVAHALTFATTFSLPLPMISSPSLVAVAVIGYLGWELVRSARGDLDIDPVGVVD